jgi:hypothetical protein
MQQSILLVLTVDEESGGVDLDLAAPFLSECLASRAA